MLVAVARRRAIATINQKLSRYTGHASRHEHDMSVQDSPVFLPAYMAAAAVAAAPAVFGCCPSVIEANIEKCV